MVAHYVNERTKNNTPVHGCFLRLTFLQLSPSHTYIKATPIVLVPGIGVLASMPVRADVPPSYSLGSATTTSIFG